MRDITDLRNSSIIHSKSLLLLPPRPQTFPPQRNTGTPASRFPSGNRPEISKETDEIEFEPLKRVANSEDTDYKAFEIGNESFHENPT